MSHLVSLWPSAFLEFASQGSHKPGRPGHHFHPFENSRNSTQHVLKSLSCLLIRKPASPFCDFKSCCPISFSTETQSHDLGNNTQCFSFFPIFSKFHSYINIDVLLSRPTLSNITMFFTRLFFVCLFLLFFVLSTRSRLDYVRNIQLLFCFFLHSLA